MKDIKIGDLVKWKCKPFGCKSFIAEGVVRGIGESTFGSVSTETSVKIEPLGEYRKFYPKRKTTTIAMKNMDDKNKEFFRVEELAQKLDVNVMTIYRYIKAKKLKAYKIGKEFRIDKQEFSTFLSKAQTN